MNRLLPPSAAFSSMTAWAVVADPANTDGGESPKAAFDVEANKATIDTTKTTTVPEV